MNNYLLPHLWKYTGWILIAIGTGLVMFYFWFDFRLKMPVFALISVFLQTKFLTTFRTNIADELILLTLVGGFFLVVFSKERIHHDAYEQFKGKALFRALFYNTILVLFSILFLYGQAFLAILVLNLLSLFLFYLVIYYTMKIRAKRMGQSG